MHPNASKHDLNINVEPTIGTTMSAQKRLQINVKLTPDFVYPEVAQPTYIPVAWMEQVNLNIVLLILSVDGRIDRCSGSGI